MAELAEDLTVDQDRRLEQAEGRVRAYCRWHIAPVRSGETYTLTAAAPLILLPTLRLVSIQSVVDENGVTLVADTDYKFTDWGAISRVTGGWGGWWSAGTVVTFTHGYDAVPPEVEAIVQALAQRAIDNPGGRIRTGDGAFSDTYATSSLTPDEKADLAPYRIVTA